MASTRGRDKKGTGGGVPQDHASDRSPDAVRALVDALARLPGSDARAEIIKGIVTFEVDRLASPGSRDDFKRLCAAGCHPAVLVGIISLLRYRADIEKYWAAFVGEPKRRDDVCRALDEAASAIERTFRSVLVDADVDPRITAIGRIPPGRLASELHVYSGTFRLADSLADDIGVRSLEDFVRLVLAGYVKRATTNDHHAEIAAILADVWNRPNYTADAQKQWRYRHRKALDDASSAVSHWSDRLRDVGSALSDAQVTKSPHN